MKKLSYAGIGSRETPTEILSLMTRLAVRLEELDYILHSGGADGADTAFEQGVKCATNKIIFLPWTNFNGRMGTPEIPPRAFEIAKQFHPSPERLSGGVLKLMARSSQQILGQNLDEPVSFVLCWHLGTGGTTQAVRIAEHHGIPVINLADSDWREKARAVVPSIKGGN